jgi:hypothetical protein
MVTELSGTESDGSGWLVIAGAQGWLCGLQFPGFSELISSSLNYTNPG